MLKSKIFIVLLFYSSFIFSQKDLETKLVGKWRLSYTKFFFAGKSWKEFNPSDTKLKISNDGTLFWFDRKTTYDTCKWTRNGKILTINSTNSTGKVSEARYKIIKLTSSKLKIFVDRRPSNDPDYYYMTFEKKK